jgi:phospholipid-binding lipoprotein MlaA
MDKIRTAVAALSVATFLAGCASGPNRTPGDPLEPMNRVVFKVNDAVDRTIAVPVAKGYQKVTPQPLRTAISNFFSNLGDLSNIANELLQLKITDATEDVIRFAMNTTFGIGGLIDFATLARLPKHHQDFGLTLGRWGVPSGPYLVLPVFGPSTFRDSVGLAVDVRFNPLNYIEPSARTPLYVLQFVSARSDMLAATNVLEQAALDKYSFVRDAYLQQRKSKLSTGSGDAGTPALPNYDDDDSGAAAPVPASGGNAGAAAAAPAAASAPGSLPAPAPDAASAPSSGAGPGAGVETGPAGSAPAAEQPGASADSPASAPVAVPATPSN